MLESANIGAENVISQMRSWPMKAYQCYSTPHLPLVLSNIIN